MIGRSRRLERGRVAVLVGLERRPDAGGHVRFWEQIARVAQALPAEAGALRLEMHFLGRGASHPGPLYPETTGSGVELYEHRPVLSTRWLPWLSAMPDHTDLAPLHPRLLATLRGASVIHATDAHFCFASTARLAARAFDRPLVTSLHTQTGAYGGLYAASLLERWASPGGRAQSLLQRWRPDERVARRMRARLAAHVSSSDWVLAGARDLAGLPVARRAGRGPLRRGLDRAVFSPDAGGAEALSQALGIPSQARVIGYCGRLSSGKRVELVADVVEGLLARGHDVHAVFAGAGSLREHLVRRLGPRGHFPGHLSPAEIAAMHTRADLFVFPSQIEYWPSAVAEAKACGVPVLVAPGGGGRLVAGDGEDGLVVEGGPAEWTAVADRALRDPALVARLARAGVEHARRHLPTWREVLTEDLLPVWRTVTRRRRKFEHVWRNHPGPDPSS